MGSGKGNFPLHHEVLVVAESIEERGFSRWALRGAASWRRTKCRSCRERPTFAGLTTGLSCTEAAAGRLDAGDVAGPRGRGPRGMSAGRRVVRDVREDIGWCRLRPR